MPDTLLSRAITELVADDELWGPAGLMPARFEPGLQDTKILVISGPNACGKSFACRYLGLVIADERKESEKISEGEFFHIGMRMRTSGNGVLGAKSFVYGDESTDSTGATSLHAVNGTIHNSKNRTRRHVIALDEPEVGLSDEYALAMGRKIATFAQSLNPLCDALILVSHSRPFISELLHLEPHFLRFGDLSTREWLDSAPIAASIEDLDTLADRNLETYRAIRKIMHERQK